MFFQILFTDTTHPNSSHSLHSAKKPVLCSVECLGQTPQTALCHDMSGSAILLSTTDGPFLNFFQRLGFILESTDSSEIMLVVRSQVENVKSPCLETQPLTFLPNISQQNKTFIFKHFVVLDHVNSRQRNLSVS